MVMAGMYNVSGNKVKPLMLTLLRRPTFRNVFLDWICGKLCAVFHQSVSGKWDTATK